MKESILISKDMFLSVRRHQAQTKSGCFPDWKFQQIILFSDLFFNMNGCQSSAKRTKVAYKPEAMILKLGWFCLGVDRYETT